MDRHDGKPDDCAADEKCKYDLTQSYCIRKRWRLKSRMCSKIKKQVNAEWMLRLILVCARHASGNQISAIKWCVRRRVIRVAITISTMKFANGTTIASNRASIKVPKRRRAAYSSLIIALKDFALKILKKAPVRLVH